MAEFPQERMPWQSDEYQLLDFGFGRKLERFGRFILDRPCPAAEQVAPSLTKPWDDADLKWRDSCTADFNHNWNVDFQLSEPTNFARGQVNRAGAKNCDGVHQVGNEQRNRLRFQLRLTPFGHVGLFPEQAENWRWLFEQIQHWDWESVSCLNLFAYTGAATLAMAAGGASVVHIDSSTPSVQWARRNAELSGMQTLPIRWIVEDAFKFIEREIRRGNRYQLIVLDPPAYGHSPSGKAWKLEDSWQELIGGCLELISSNSQAGLLWTGHSPVPSMDQIRQTILLKKSTDWLVDCGNNDLLTVDGRRLNHGYFVRAIAK